MSKNPIERSCTPEPDGHLRGRRHLLAGMCAAAGTLAVTPAWSAIQRASGRNEGIIDVHHHILPPDAPEAMVGHFRAANWTPAGAVAEMDQTGIRAGMAYPGPIRAGAEPERRNKARVWNEFGSKLGQDHPGRFGLFASLPFPFVDSCIAEIDYALDHLKADGFGITTSYDDLWLGDEKLWPIYEKLNSRAAVVFVHPHDAACCGGQKYHREVTDDWFEWPMNTARTIFSLMSSGTIRKFPNIRFIFSHGGGVMPLLLKRIEGLAAYREVGPETLKSLFPNGMEQEFRTLRFECAQAASRTNMAALRSLVPDSQILFGSDYPFFPLPYGTGQFARLALPAATHKAIASGNAAALLPRWA